MDKNKLYKILDDADLVRRTTDDANTLRLAEGLFTLADEFMRESYGIGEDITSANIREGR
jgi:hypothetical protein